MEICGTKIRKASCSPSPEPECDRRRVSDVRIQLAILQEALGTEAFRLRVRFGIV